eukprot:g28751.t1
MTQKKLCTSEDLPINFLPNCTSVNNGRTGLIEVTFPSEMAIWWGHCSLVFVVPVASCFWTFRARGGARRRAMSGAAGLSLIYCIIRCWLLFAFVKFTAGEGFQVQQSLHVHRRIQSQLFSEQSRISSQLMEHLLAKKSMGQRLAPDNPLSKLKVWWQGECGCTGLQLEMLELVLPLVERGLQIQVNDCGSNVCVFRHRPPIAKMLEEMKSRPRFSMQDAHVVITHEAFAGPCDQRHNFRQKQYHISRSMIETESLVSSAASRCASPQWDELWVPSAFNRQSFLRAGVPAAKLFVLPEAVDTSVWRPRNSDSLSQDPLLEKDLLLQNMYRSPVAPKLPRGKYTFLSVFKWEERKNWKGLVRAFVEEFGKEPHVALWIKTYRAWEGDPEQDLAHFLQDLRASGLKLEHNTIQLVTVHIDTKDLPVFFSFFDCFVMPTHGEGWGLPIHEAMAMGMPVITTAWGGATEFAMPANVNTSASSSSVSFAPSPSRPQRSAGPAAVGQQQQQQGGKAAAESRSAQEEQVPGAHEWGYAIRVANLAPVYAGGWEPGQRWAEPSVLHLRQLMRHVTEHQQEARSKGQAARQHIVERFSSSAVADLYQARLQQIVQNIQTNPNKYLPIETQQSAKSLVSEYQSACARPLERVVDGALIQKIRNRFQRSHYLCSTQIHPRGLVELHNKRRWTLMTMPNHTETE